MTLFKTYSVYKLISRIGDGEKTKFVEVSFFHKTKKEAVDWIEDNGSEYVKYSILPAYQKDTF